MKKTLLMLLILILPLISLVSAETFSPGVVLNTSSSNSSITFSFQVTVSEVQINDNSIFMNLIYYTWDGKQYLCDSFNHTTPNSNLDSSEFGCALSGGGISGKVPVGYEEKNVTAYDKERAKEKSVEFTTNFINFMKNIGGYMYPSKPGYGVIIMFGGFLLIIFLFIRNKNYLYNKIKKPLQKQRKVSWITDV